MPKLYTLKQIAAAYQRPISTTGGHIMRLRADREFEKKSRGAFYTWKEVCELKKLLGFKMSK